MGNVNDRLHRALRVAREQGVAGVAQAVGRRLGLPAMQPVLDEAAIAWDFFHLEAKPGVMIDVGAHHGGSLRPFLRQGWRVQAFEPDPANRALLLAEFADCPTLSVDMRAVSDQPRQGVTFFRSDLSTGISGLSAFDPSHRAEHQVDVTTLTSVLSSTDIDRIDFLKIDTEGHDLFVLRGMPWARLQPRLLLCEYENHKTEPLGYRYEDLAAYIVAQGYTLITSEWYPIEKYGVQHAWRQFAEGSPPPIIDPKGWGNILAVRDAADMPALRAACARAAKREHARTR